MDRFHNDYGAMNEEATSILTRLDNAVKPIIDEYKDDIEALVFMRGAFTFLEANVSEAILRYAMNKRKNENRR